MKTKLAYLTVAVLLSAAGTSPVLAHQDYSESSSYHNLAHVASTSSPPSERQLAPFGYAVKGQAGRSVTIDGGTRYLNVTRGEIVQLNVGSESLTWMFDTLGTASFPLDKIISGANNVTVYVDRSPSEAGG